MSNFCIHKLRSKSPLKIIAIIIFGGIIISGIITLCGFVIMWLWNWLMPEIFGLTTLTFWQSLGLLALSKILIGGGGFGKDKKHHSKKSGSKTDRNPKNDFSKWKHYDDFWKQEGSKAYDAYVERQRGIAKPVEDDMEEDSKSTEE